MEHPLAEAGGSRVLWDRAALGSVGYEWAEGDRILYGTFQKNRDTLRFLTRSRSQWSYDLPSTILGPTSWTPQTLTRAVSPHFSHS